MLRRRLRALGDLGLVLRERGGKAARAEEADEIEDGETLLDHLVRYTSGEWVCCRCGSLVFELGVGRFDGAA